VSVPALDGRGCGLVRADLDIRAGEFVAIAAIDGNGQRELMLMIAGLLTPSEGTAEISSSVALVPADRTTEGLISEFSLTENVVLGLLAGVATAGGKRSVGARGWIDWSRAEEQTRDLLEQFDVRAPGPAFAAGALSGGNQQKLILGRALAQRPAVLIAENPTRGLDVQAASEIRHHLREAVANGTAVLFYSSDLDEVLTLGASRLLVLASGRLQELPVTADRDQVGKAMLTAEGSGGAVAGT
jgi:simple sugar transport system ATP-binding protein